MQPSDQVRAGLIQLVNATGAHVADEPRRVEAWLRDRFPHHGLECHLLATAAKERIPQDLCAWSSWHGRSVATGQLAHRLVDRCGVDPALARWAFDSWVRALGLPVEHLLDVIDPPQPGEPTPLAGDVPPPQVAVSAVEPCRIVRENRRSWVSTSIESMLGLGLVGVAGVVLWGRLPLGSDPSQLVAMASPAVTEERMLLTVAPEAARAPAPRSPMELREALTARLTEQATQRADLVTTMRRRLAVATGRHEHLSQTRAALDFCKQRLEAAARRGADENRWPVEVDGRSYDAAALRGVIGMVTRAIADTEAALQSDAAADVALRPAIARALGQGEEIQSMLRRLRTADNRRITGIQNRVGELSRQLDDWRSSPLLVTPGVSLSTEVRRLLGR